MLAQGQTLILHNIFGPYVMNTKVIPGREKPESEREVKIRSELIEAVDDYVEEA